MNKKDRRVEKTEENIENSLMDLLTYKSLNKITITEVAANAGVERKTFYLHYDSIDDVLHEIENKLQKELADKISSQKRLSSEKLLQILNELMLENRSFYRGVLISSPNVFLNDDFQLILQRGLKENFLNLDENADPEFSNYYASFIAAGIVQCYREFLEGSNKDPEVLDYFLKDIFDKITK